MLDSGSVPRLVELIGRVASFTTDMGTEMGIADYRCQNIYDILPLWRRPAVPLEDDVHVQVVDGAGVGAGAGAGEPAKPQAEGLFLFPRSLAIVGMLHVISNALADMTTKIDGWADFLEQLKLV